MASSGRAWLPPTTASSAPNGSGGRIEVVFGNELLGGIAMGMPLPSVVFNGSHPDLPSVHYFTYAGAGTGSFVLKPSHAYLELAGRTPEDVLNDGLVTVSSAKRGGLTEPPWPTDHIGEVGHNLDGPPDFAWDFDHFSAIDRIVQRLRSL